MRGNKYSRGQGDGHTRDEGRGKDGGDRKETHMELDQKQKEVRISAQVGCPPTVTVTHPDDCRSTWEHTRTIMFA
jgi:hypothetical protein